MSDFPFGGSPDEDRSDILRTAEAERLRQWRKLIMIPSESICHPAAAEVLTGDLGNIYAEGLPQPILSHDPREAAADARRFGSWQTRLADRRYYKGTVGANRAELVAQRCIAEVFSRLEGSPRADEIHVNVQALSGAAANLSVFEALLEPGDGLMGLDLSHGGHLTHGSQFNVSGKTYQVQSYGVEPGAERLDYDLIRERALEFGPRILIGGASSYPWDFDWQRLRAIADEAGAYLLADVAHLAGLIAGGVLRNPVPHAHVVTFTTHKTLCGPRGAVILTADPEIGHAMDMAVFPGLQGGPHMNSIAAIGRLFEIILEDPGGFAGFGRKTVENTAYLAERLVGEGFRMEYGGTDTHMLLVDLKPFEVERGARLDGEIAARLLEIAGIVCNKNVIPGDPDAAHATGLRFGMPWLTQRGVTRAQIEEIAAIVRSVLAKVRTFEVWCPQGEEKCRGRVPFGLLREASGRTLAIAEALPYPERPGEPPVPEVDSKLGDRTALLVRGDKVRLALGQMLTASLPADGGPVRAKMLRDDGSEIDDVIAAELEHEGREERAVVLAHSGKAAAARQWIEELSDGYVVFDEDDLYKKVDGPSVVEELDVAELPEALKSEIAACEAEPPAAHLARPYFIGQGTLYAEAAPAAKPAYECAAPELPLRQTVLNAVHKELGAKMAPFAGWEMPIQYPDGIFEEHRAVRTGAGLFDVSHMRALEVRGRASLEFLDGLLANCVSRLDPGEAQYSCMLYPDGTTVDDIYVYRLARERFMIVANAANAERVIDWLRSAASGSVMIDPAMRAKELPGPVEILDLHDAGEASRAGLAIQGPASRAVLMGLAEGGPGAERLGRLAPNAFWEFELAGLAATVARTGYTGEALGYEVYVHPDGAPKLWNAMLDEGRELGVRPAGLGARDSTRVEAGFPLFGHEIEGDLGISMTEAGYGFAVRFHVPFFVGRGSYMARARGSKRHLLRLAGQGRKSLRAGHVILDGSGAPVGEVTSFAYVREDMSFVVFACVEEGFRPAPGEPVTGARVGAGKLSGKVSEKQAVELTALTRFPDDDEREGWAALYA